MIRVTAIPYLNTTPFVYGLKQKMSASSIELGYATPAQAAHQLQNDLCDIAIVPVAAVPALPWYEIIGNHCIGAVSAVASVLLCSQVPVDQIKEVALDSESQTSVRLAQLLLLDYWHITPHYVPLPVTTPHHAISSATSSAAPPASSPTVSPATPPAASPRSASPHAVSPQAATTPHHAISSATSPATSPAASPATSPVASPTASPHSVSPQAATPLSRPESVVLIGDKALRYGGTYPYVYDLAEHWIRWSGKPFVFALWVANKPLPPHFADTFSDALAYGVAHIPETIAENIAAQTDNRFPPEVAYNYLTHNISYPLDAAKREGMHLFWELI